MHSDETGRHSYLPGSTATSFTATPAYRVEGATVLQPAFSPSDARRNGAPIGTVVTIVLALVALGLVGAFAYTRTQAGASALSALGPGPTVLRSACEKGIRDEYDRRVAGSDSLDVVSALSSIVVGQDIHRDNAEHYSIDGSFTATAAAALIGSIPVNVLVTCEITTKGSSVVVVAVINR